jgi:hypothetical protein
MGKRCGEQFWRKHIEAWDRSELTQAAYCAAHGLNTKSFYRWWHKQSAPLASSLPNAPLTLVPVKVDRGSAHGLVRLRSPGGWAVGLPGANAAWLSELLRRLP